MLTGFLGAGKTTLLNALLPQPALAGTLVVINEFGATGLDHHLIEMPEADLVLLASGCLCCSIRGDLIRLLEDLLRRRDNHRMPPFARLIIETTGLADPAPVAQTFFVDQDVQDKSRLDAIITVADAKWLSDRLKDAPEAKNQIAFADVILLNKIDLVTPAELQMVEARIRGINPYARLIRTQKCDVPLSEVLDRGAFDLDRILELEPEFLEAGHHHHHDEEMQSMSIEIDGDVDPDKFMPWINDVVQRDGPDILRSKGILAFTNEPKRFVYQGVHMILDGDLQRDWRPDEKRTSKIVFIGRHLKTDELRKGFLACKA